MLNKNNKVAGYKIKINIKIIYTNNMLTIKFEEKQITIAFVTARKRIKYLQIHLRKGPMY